VDPPEQRRAIVLHTPLTRTERRKEKTRRLLMDVALDLFLEKGIYWTKIEDITQRADVGKGTFYQYFETKEALLQELLDRGLGILLTLTAGAVGTGTRNGETLALLIRAHLDFYLEHPEYLLLFHQVRGLLQLKTGSVQELRAAYQRYLDDTARILLPVLGNGGNRFDDARELGMALSALTSGLLTHHFLFGNSADLKQKRIELQKDIEQSLLALLS
jgi:AcrR family transcriptional regulator